MVVFLSGVNSQPISLTSSLNGQQDVRHGENILFQCITRGSTTLAWSSNEYISDRIEFLKVHSNGTTADQNPYASARLISAYTDEAGEPVIKSELTIIVQRTIPQSSVTCHHVGDGLTDTIPFRLSSKFPCQKSVHESLSDSTTNFNPMTLTGTCM